MAERVSQKSKRQAAPVRPAARSSSARAAPAASKRTAAAEIDALEKERDQLKAQLAAAKAQLIKLEQARDEAVGRIDWALDSLHNLLENGA
jgi:ribosomal 50S subunit-associated protein YjgA (DUF615 family)